MVKLSDAKYWFAYGYLDGYEGKECAPIISIPEFCRGFYERGYSCGTSFERRHNLTEAAKRVLCS
mgnify:CR=1 FL=1